MYFLFIFANNFCFFYIFNQGLELLACLNRLQYDLFVTNQIQSKAIFQFLAYFSIKIQGFQRFQQFQLLQFFKIKKSIKSKLIYRSKFFAIIYIIFANLDQTYSDQIFYQYMLTFSLNDQNVKIAQAKIALFISYRILQQLLSIDQLLTYFYIKLLLLIIKLSLLLLSQFIRSINVCFYQLLPNCQIQIWLLVRQKIKWR
ncbi:hypothetical protein ABPG74_003721 [Tetrahymena malaccensis]